MVRRQGRPPGRPAVLPHGRLLRTVLRRRRSRRRRARHRPLAPGRARRRADPDVRCPPSRLRNLSPAPDPPRLSRRHRRADGRPEIPPRWHKTPIRRAVVRLVTPGTITEETLLEAGRPNLLLALAQARDHVGAAWLDVSTGIFETAAAEPNDLPALLGRLEPAEILAPETLPLGDWTDRRAPVQIPSPPLVARRRLAEAFGAVSLDAFGTFTDGEAVAASLALDYVRATQAGTLPRLARPEPQGERGVLAMDAATRASLEIHRSRDGGAQHTLIAAIQRTLTPAAGASAGRLACSTADRSDRHRRPPGCVVVDARQSRCGGRTAVDPARRAGHRARVGPDLAEPRRTARPRRPARWPRGRDPRRRRAGRSPARHPHRRPRRPAGRLGAGAPTPGRPGRSRAAAPRRRRRHPRRLRRGTRRPSFVAR